MRTESSGFQIPDSLTFTDLENQLQTGRFQPLAPDAPLQHLAFVTLPTVSAKKWCQKQKIALNLDIPDFVRVYETEDNFLGIGKLQDDFLIPQMVFSELKIPSLQS
jgi:tRNA pseudouridine55 synthase